MYPGNTIPFHCILNQIIKQETLRILLDLVNKYCRVKEYVMENK